MRQITDGTVFWGWLAVASVAAFALFGCDKWLAKRGSTQRISEFTLLSICALGGWPGGLIGLIAFRHKSAKLSFQLKFFGAFVLFGGLVAGGLRFMGKI